MLKTNLLKFLNKKHDWIVNIRVSGEDPCNRAYEVGGKAETWWLKVIMRIARNVLDWDALFGCRQMEKWLESDALQVTF